MGQTGGIENSGAGSLNNTGKLKIIQKGLNKLEAISIFKELNKEQTFELERRICDAVEVISARVEATGEQVNKIIEHVINQVGELVKKNANNADELNKNFNLIKSEISELITKQEFFEKLDDFSDKIIGHIDFVAWKDVVAKVEQLHECLNKEHSDAQEIFDICNLILCSGAKTEDQNTLAKFCKTICGGYLQNDRNACRSVLKNPKDLVLYCPLYIEDALMCAIRFWQRATIGITQEFFNGLMAQYNSLDFGVDYSLLQNFFNDDKQKNDKNFYDINQRNIFIMYSSENVDDVDILCVGLEDKGLRPFAASRNLRHHEGIKFKDKIKNAIKKCDAIVFVSSPESRKLNDNISDECDWWQQKIKDDYKSINSGITYEDIPSEVNVRAIYAIDSVPNNKQDPEYIKTTFHGIEFFHKDFRSTSSLNKLAEALKQDIKTKHEYYRNISNGGNVSPQTEVTGNQEPNHPTPTAATENIRSNGGEKSNSLTAILNKKMNNIRSNGGDKSTENSNEGNGGIKLPGIKPILKSRQDEKISLIYNLTLNKDGKSYSVSGLKDKSICIVEIPSQYKGLPVTSISDHAFQDCTTFTRAVISESICEIGERAFSGCTRLSFVELPKNLTKICDFAFDSCSNLNSVELPRSLIKLGVGVFRNCDNIREMVIPESIDEISDFLFADCYDLQKVIMGDAVTKVGREAFLCCPHLTYIKLSKQLHTIEYKAFAHCYSLKEIIIPKGVVKLEDNAFLATGLLNIEIPNSVICLGQRVFHSCGSLRRVVLGDGIKEISSGTFAWCEQLNTIKLSSSLEVISTNAFYRCLELTNLVLPETLISIKKGAFCGCKRITEINIPRNVAAIEEPAFEMCFKLKSFSVDERNVNYSVINGNLYDSHKTKLIRYAPGRTEQQFTIPNGIESISQGAFNCCPNLKNISIAKNEKYKSIDGNLYNSDATVLLQYAVGKRKKAFIVPASVAEIGYGAFSGCVNLIKIKLPEGIKIIGEEAFSWCANLRVVKLPDTMESINDGAFDYCLSLKRIKLNIGLKKIGSYAFRRCLIKKVYIPKSIESIGNYAFDNECITSFIVDEENKFYKSVDECLFNYDETTLISYPSGNSRRVYTIPSNVKRIEPYAFRSSFLLEIKFEKTADWGRFDSCAFEFVPISDIDIANVHFVARYLKFLYYDQVWVNGESPMDLILMKLSRFIEELTA